MRPTNFTVTLLLPFTQKECQTYFSETAKKGIRSIYRQLRSTIQRRRMGWVRKCQKTMSVLWQKPLKLINPITYKGDDKTVNRIQKASIIKWHAPNQNSCDTSQNVWFYKQSTSSIHKWKTLLTRTPIMQVCRW